jgi:hypothetical protein
MSVNGKGSRSRVRDYDGYRDNYDLIFKKKEQEQEETNDQADQEDSGGN